VLQEGGHVISEDGKSSGVNTPEGIRGIQFWVDLIQKYEVSPTLQQMADTDPGALFQSGKIAMMYHGSWGVNEMKEMPYILENVSIAPMAQIEVPGGTAGGITNVIFKNTKHADAAWRFLQHLGGEQAALYQAESGIIPAYESAQSTWVDSTPESLNAGVFLDALEVATPLPSSVDVAVWRDFAIEELTRAYEGKVDVPTAAARIAEVMDEVLASAGGD
jgi:multiple sugar transport system substrate-binding protein